MKNQDFHKDFFLNGNRFDSDSELLNYSKTLSKSIYSFLSNWFNRDDFIVVKTSGSTGKPKEIKLKKQHMMNSAIATGNYFDLQNNTSALLCLSTDFIAGKMMLVRALTLGWQLDVTDPGFSPLSEVEKNYDFCAMVPLQVYNSLNKLSLIKKLIVGGGVISKELENKLQQVSTEVFATYGMTETITHIAVKKLNHDLAPYYQILSNVTISRDNRGCLVIKAPNVSDETIITNDFVEIISDNNFKWLGRYDNIINSGGIKLIPEQIEDKLSKIIDSRFFVIGIPDKVLGEKLILVIESCKEGKVILNKVKNLKELTKYEIPKAIYFTPKFVETETKKTQRQKTLDLIFKSN